MRAAIPRIDILMTGQTLPAIRAKHGDFDQWFQDRSEGAASFRLHSVYNGMPIPAVGDSDGWIITGASISVNDADPWLRDLKKMVGQAVVHGHPILGVCFGHQLLAVSCGGRVRMNPKGWELGTTEVDLTSAGTASPLFAGIGSPIMVYQTHQETVTDLPPEAKILAENALGIQAFQIGRRAFGVQFHPEFTREIAGMYVELRREKSGTNHELSDGGADASQRIIANFIQLITREEI